MKKTILTLLFLGISLPASAHGVHLFCYQDATNLKCEGYFSGGSPAQHSRVQIYRKTDNTLLAEGKTDENGEFQIPISENTGMKIILLAGQGHRAEFILDKPDLVYTPRDDLKKQKGEDSACDQRIKNLEAQLVESKEELIKYKKKMSSPSMLEIFCGIGWIFTFFLFTYIWKKKNAS